MSGYIYLASPYTSDSERQRQARYKQALRAAQALMARGEIVFSPVAYGHSFEEAARKTFPYDYWIRWSKAILAGASKLYVLTAEGWDESNGVREEVKLAHSLNIPIVGYSADSECEDVSGFAILGTFGLAPIRPPIELPPPEAASYDD